MSIKHFLTIFSIFLLLVVLPTVGQAGTLTDRLKGYILLQVQSHGEAWYVNPVDSKRYYLKDGAVAYEAMRRFGLGITNTDLTRLLAGDSALRTRLSGRIMLQVQAHGEAYYVCPRDRAVQYIKDGNAAYQIMRQCSLGITNADLAQISIGTLASNPATPPSSNPPATQTSSAQLAGCSIFPADNPWNQRVDTLPLNANSATYINSISATKTLHPDFGENMEYGIPYNVVSGSQAKVPMTFEAYGDESDPGPYPIPSDAKVEAGGDAHVLVLDSGACKLYELYAAEKNGAGWTADSGATWDLRSNALRPEGWTSADAAGLPILPGLVKIDEVLSGSINHAIRFTAPKTQNGYIHPATHAAGSNNAALPPMGLRLRLKSNFDISPYTGQARIILEAMKKYGLILADNGSAWFFQGTSDSRWNDEELNQLKTVPGSAFEAVETGAIIK